MLMLNVKERKGNTARGHAGKKRPSASEEEEGEDSPLSSPARVLMVRPGRLEQRRSAPHFFRHPVPYLALNHLVAVAKGDGHDLAPWEAKV